jgi:hypothetical protein
VLTVEVISDSVRYTLVAVFALFAAFHALSPSILRRIYRGSDYAIATMRTIAIPLAFAAAFLVVPHTHIWGIALAAFTLFAVIVTLLFRGRYAWAVLGMLALTALPIAILAAPLS